MFEAKLPTSTVIALPSLRWMEEGQASSVRSKSRYAATEITCRKKSTNSLIPKKLDPEVLQKVSLNW